MESLNYCAFVYSFLWKFWTVSHFEKIAMRRNEPGQKGYHLDQGWHKGKTVTKSSYIFFVFIIYLDENYNTKQMQLQNAAEVMLFWQIYEGPYHYLGADITADSLIISVLFLLPRLAVFPAMTLVQFSTRTVLFPSLIHSRPSSPGTISGVTLSLLPL